MTPPQSLGTGRQGERPRHRSKWDGSSGCGAEHRAATCEQGDGAGLDWLLQHGPGAAGPEPAVEIEEHGARSEQPSRVGGPEDSTGALGRVDHVVPRSLGGTHTWDNVVAACRRCNSKKENRLPHDAGLHLPRKPFVPSDGFRLSLGRPEPEWEPYLA